MWPRVVEFMLACWLAISPFIFSYPGSALFLWFNDFSCASLMAIFSLLSYYEHLRKLHLCNLAISLYLISLSYFFKGSTFEAPLQNYMVLGLLLLMIAILPTDADKPPKPWRDFYKE